MCSFLRHLVHAMATRWRFTVLQDMAERVARLEQSLMHLQNALKEKDGARHGRRAFGRRDRSFFGRRLAGEETAVSEHHMTQPAKPKACLMLLLYRSYQYVGRRFCTRDSGTQCWT